jgi:hypothetical protein
MEEKAVTRYNAGAIIEQVVIKGDLAALKPEDRVNYYNAVSSSIGVNPLTKPFEYIELNGKLVLYATRNCTDQLREGRKINVTIVNRERIEDAYVVTARATMPDGRTDESVGAVSLMKEDGEWKTAQSGKRYFERNGKWLPLRGDDLANALMKAETKAKRRVTLSIVGLSLLDETEIETIPSARLAPVNVHVETPQASTTNGNSQQKKVSREDLEKLWQNKLWPKAQALGIDVEAISQDIETAELARRCKELHQAIRDAEAAIPTGANP